MTSIPIPHLPPSKSNIAYNPTMHSLSIAASIIIACAATAHLLISPPPHTPSTLSHNPNPRNSAALAQGGSINPGGPIQQCTFTATPCTFNGPIETITVYEVPFVATVTESFDCQGCADVTVVPKNCGGPGIVSFVLLLFFGGGACEWMKVWMEWALMIRYDSLFRPLLLWSSLSLRLLWTSVARRPIDD